jgi:hypothetical protein
MWYQNNAHIIVHISNDSTSALIAQVVVNATTIRSRPQRPPFVLDFVKLYCYRMMCFLVNSDLHFKRPNKTTDKIYLDHY